MKILIRGVYKCNMGKKWVKLLHAANQITGNCESPEKHTKQNANKTFQSFKNEKRRLLDRPVYTSFDCNESHLSLKGFYKKIKLAKRSNINFDSANWH